MVRPSSPIYSRDHEHFRPLMFGGDCARARTRLFYRLPDRTCCNAFEDWEGWLGGLPRRLRTKRDQSAWQAAEEIAPAARSISINAMAAAQKYRCFCV
jgi:hypothetical protein